MASLVLPASLSTNYRVDEATLADTDDLHAMLVRRAMDVLGFVHITLDNTRGWLTPLFPDSPQFQFLVRRRDTTSVAAVCMAEREFNANWMTVAVRCDTRLPTGDADALAGALWPQVLSWCRAAHASGADGRLVLHTGALAPDVGQIRELTQVGFVHERTYWSMAGSASARPEPATSVPGLSIEPVIEPHPVHDIIQRAFAGSWGFDETAYDDWVAAEKSVPGYDVGLWRIAVLAGQSVAAMIMSRSSADLGELYVQELATLEHYRRRGIASALLNHAFDVARAQGLGTVALHVDTDNTTDALSVYVHAGLEPRLATANQYTLRLSSEKSEES